MGASSSPGHWPRSMPSLTSRIIASLDAAHRCFLPSTDGCSHDGRALAIFPEARGLDGQRELVLGGGPGQLEARDADAEQANRPGRGEPA